MSKYRNKEIEEYSEMFAALSNPNRLRLLLRIIDRCESGSSCDAPDGIGACVGELADGLGLAPSTVSHHLKELRRSGLISMTRHGRSIECSIDSRSLGQLSTLLERAAVGQPV